VKRIVVEPEAETELHEAYTWYETQNTGLGSDFLLCIEAALTSARDRPRSFPYIHRQTRRVLVRRFPYLILFRDLPDQTVVLGVMHAARDPKHFLRSKG